jgi:hypothetical protein
MAISDVGLLLSSRFTSFAQPLKNACSYYERVPQGINFYPLGEQSRLAQKIPLVGVSNESFNKYIS